MNHIYIYKHDNGVQFQSGADPICTKVWFTYIGEQVPKLIGIWRFKTVKIKKDGDK